MLRERTKEVLQKHGIKLSKSMGQPQVVDEELLGRMVSYANLSEEDVVLEVGPGIGNLTGLLLKNAGRVIAIERDERLIRVLRERFGDEAKLEIIGGDALKVRTPRFDKIVSNLPYAISSKITFKILNHRFELGVLMYQKEFARRMIAPPGSSDYSRLSVQVFYRARAEILEEVPPSSFLPPPEVDSAVMKIYPREPPFDVKDEALFSRTIRAAFQHRRKKVRNALYHSFEVIFPESKTLKSERKLLIDKELPDDLANSRVAELSPEEFGRLADILSNQSFS